MGTPPGEPLRLVFSPWVKLCSKGADPKAKRICVTVSDGRQDDGKLMVSVAVVEMDGDARKFFRLRMPYSVALQHGTRLIVDQQTPATAPFVTCMDPEVPPGGCIADYAADADLIARLKSGRTLTVQAIQMSGQSISQQLALDGFAGAYDGPPTDPKLFEEQQKKLRQKPIRDDTLQPHLRPWN